MNATGQPGSQGYPPSHGAFGAQPPQPAPETYGNPYGAAAYPPQGQQAPAQAAWGAPAPAQAAWGAAAAPAQPGWGAPAPQAYGFAPGTQVQVTWSNGQRYPGTVQQTSGTQVLVLFPDGQQHWVEMHYVTAG